MSVRLRPVSSLVLWAVPLVVSAAQTTVSTTPPNVVLLLSDDQAWTDYGFMGDKVVQTPHLDRLAAERAVFLNGYVPTSLCRPSLATLVTGQYPHTHGITGNDPPRGTDRREMLTLLRRAPKLPALLGRAGYESFQAGKWWEGNSSEGGFTEGMTQGDPARGGRHGDLGLAIGRQGLQPIWNFLDNPSRIEPSRGKRSVDSDAAQPPFFLWYAPMLPHDPHNPPERLLRRYRRPGTAPEVARYQACIEWFDETVGELLDGLEGRGLTGSTLIVFSCDNGWAARCTDPNCPPDWKQPFDTRSKRSPYDAGVRTPILLHWPGMVAPGRRCEPVSSVDIAPTILRACGAEPPETMAGQDLLAVAAGKAVARDTVYGAIFEHDLPDLSRPTAGLLFRWCRRGDWKLIVPAGSSKDADAPPQLYDVAHDPHETRNLADARQAKAAELRAALDAWWTP